MEIQFSLVPAEECFNSQPQPGTHAGSGRSQPIFWDDCGALNLLSAAVCDGDGCASSSQGFSGLDLISELEEAGELCTLAQILMPDVEERF